MYSGAEAREALNSVGSYIDSIVNAKNTLLRINSQLNSRIVKLENEIAELKKERRSL